MEDWLQTNRALWDERVPIHVASEFYDVDAFLGGSRHFERLRSPRSATSTDSHSRIRSVTSASTRCLGRDAEPG
jgi:hypothetical protein